jgi:hypothetical protein
MVAQKEKTRQLFNSLAVIADADEDVQIRLGLLRTLGRSYVDPVAVKVVLEIEEFERKYNLALQLCEPETLGGYALRRLLLRNLVKEGLEQTPDFYLMLKAGCVNDPVKVVLDLYYKPRT